MAKNGWAFRVEFTDSETPFDLAEGDEKLVEADDHEVVS